MITLKRLLFVQITTTRCFSKLVWYSRQIYRKFKFWSWCTHVTGKFLFQKCPIVPKMSDSNRKYWSVSTVGMVGIISFHITSVIANYTEQSEQHHKVAWKKVHHLVVRRFIGHVPDEFTSLQNRFFQNHFKSKLQQAVNSPSSWVTISCNVNTRC